VRNCDVAIAGAGPAGTSAAILLARAGLSVRLVAGSGPRAQTIEGASPRVAALLARFGLAAEGMAPAVPRHAEWGALASAPNREHPLDRARFDAGLLTQASDEGVEVIRAAVARLDPAGGALVLADGRIVPAGRLVEARGRRAPAAAGRCRGPATLAIVAPDPDPVGGGTRLQARAAGWTWRAGLPDGRGVVQVVTDPAGSGRAGLAEAWARVTGAALPEGATATAAEMRLTAPDLDPACPRLGDAAIAIDPLSGHGLFWALSSALMLPPILAALEAGEVSLARRFWRDRAAATFWRQARVGRDLHRLAGLSGPFWAARAAWPDDAPAHAEVSAPTLRRQVVVEAGRLVEAEAVIAPNAPEGAAFLAGRPLVPLLRGLGAGLSGPEALALHLPGCTAAEVRAAHDWLSAAGLTDPAALSELTRPLEAVP
jgi:hypothetical protein